MLRTKQVYIEYLKEVKSLLKDNDFKSKNKLDELKLSLEQCELIIPVIGGFSAGKSTLINSFLGSEILSTNLTPETALATELRFSNENYFVAVKIDGSFDKYDLNQNDEIKKNASKYKYLKLYLNNDKLKKIEPLVLVDMPGFDSPLGLHNQAILNYLNKGVYFVILSSIEDGNITKSLIRELENITEFNKEFTFCISKVNLKGNSDVSNVKNKISNQLEDYFDYKKEIVSVSDKDGSELENILTAIDVEELFKSIFIDNLKYNHMELESSLNTIIATLKISKEDIKDVVNELKQSLNNIINKKENIIRDAKSKYSDTNVNSIIEAVSRELISNKETLISLALKNSDAFSQEINQIIKTTLIYEVKTRIEDTSSEIVDSFSLEIKNIDAFNNFELGEKWVETISNSTKNFLQNANNGLNDLVSNREGNKNNESGTLYKVITTTLGMTTKIISPLLEIVIVFLPEIISFFTGKSKERKQEEQINNKLLIEIIPSLKTKLRSSLPDIFNQQIITVIESIGVRFEEQLKQKEEEIITIEEEKKNNVKNIEEEIKKLEIKKNNLQDLATKNLYIG